MLLQRAPRTANPRSPAIPWPQSPPGRAPNGLEARWLRRVLGSPFPPLLFTAVLCAFR
jgi:hypothetical protein